MKKVILVPNIEAMAAVDLAAYNTVEAEYGDRVIEAVGGVTLAHHGSRSANPAPCVAEVEPNDLPIIVSHADLDTIGGIMALWGDRDMADDTEAAFWQLAAFVDVNGPHRVSQAKATDKIVRRLNAWYAWLNNNRIARAEAVTDITQYVLGAVSTVRSIIGGDASMIVAGETWHKDVTASTEACLVREDANVRAFVTNGVFCGASYYSPTLQAVAKATVALNTKFNAVTVAFEDGGKQHSAVEVVQKLWGLGAGGHSGIAGSPRGQQMTRDDLDKAVTAVQALYQ